MVRHTRVLSLSVMLLVLVQQQCSVQAVFYLPGIAPEDFTGGDEVRCIAVD